MASAKRPSVQPPAQDSAQEPAQESAPSRRTYVLDTSVLLADPGALKRFEEHEVVLPVVVITELEGKRHHPELGYFARSALRMLDELRVQNGRLDEPVPVGDLGGTIRVELNHTDPESLPSGFRLGDNDTRILAVARNLANEGREVILISKDLPLRIKASAVGLDAAEYRGEQIHESDAGWTGMTEIDVTRHRHRRAVRRPRDRPRRRTRAAVPHRPGDDVGAGERARSGEGRQAGPSRARRP